MPTNKYSKVALTAELALALFLCWAFYTPIPFSILKIAILCGVPLLLVGLAIQFRWAKWLALMIAVSAATIAIWPRIAPTPADLRLRYSASLRLYEGTPYVWGGENARGIDCSGLIRRGMIDALLSAGVTQHNPSLWREAGEIWWRDCSAREMKNGYGGKIKTVMAACSLNQLNTTPLRPGDLAVMKSGVHVLAYLGDRTWIQADPNLANGGNKVIETASPSRSGWFGQKVVICRWADLS